MLCHECILEPLGRAQAYLLSVWSRTLPPQSVWVAVGFLDLAIDNVHQFGHAADALLDQLVTIRNRVASSPVPLPEQEFAELVISVGSLAVDGGKGLRASPAPRRK